MKEKIPFLCRIGWHRRFRATQTSWLISCTRCGKLRHLMPV